MCQVLYNKLKGANIILVDLVSVGKNVSHAFRELDGIAKPIRHDFTDAFPRRNNIWGRGKG